MKQEHEGHVHKALTDKINSQTEQEHVQNTLTDKMNSLTKHEHEAHAPYRN